VKFPAYLAGVAVCAICAAAPANAVTCFPAASDVVSLGEATTRVYAERSLDKHVEEKKQLIATRGESVGQIRGRQMDCKPFPNLLGADEWQCIGKARVCASK
jgi:hypothetical protein